MGHAREVGQAVVLREDVGADFDDEAAIGQGHGQRVNSPAKMYLPLLSNNNWFSSEGNQFASDPNELPPEPNWVPGATRLV
ncbi:hypothetical protein GCM10028822_34590 [Hymenobacter terrigena]